MDQDNRKSRVESLSGGINGRQILVRFLLSLTVALLARGLYEGFVGDNSDESTRVTSSTEQVSSLITSPVTTGMPSTTSSVPPNSSTSLVENDPEKALILLADELTAKDRSKVSESKCGRAAVLVLAREVRFLKWVNMSWKPFVDLIVLEGVGAPRSVTTADYTEDGSLDFLVTYSSANTQEPFVGGIFSMKSCAWNWLDFELASGRAQTAPLLSFDVDNKLLTANMGSGNGVATPITFDETLRVFTPVAGTELTEGTTP